MGSDRCPSCAAAVRPDAEWCTLCYADLRRAPEPVARAPYPQPSAPARVATPAAAVAANALHAPYEHVLAAVYGGPIPTGELAPPEGATEPAVAAVAAGWPCTRCGEVNDFDNAACSACGAAFGAMLKSASPDIDRKKMMMYAVAAVITFLVLVAGITFATTKTPTDNGNTPRYTPGTTAPVDPGAQDQGPAQPAQQQPVDPNTAPLQ